MARTKPKTDNLLNFTDAATILGVTRPTVYTMIERGELHPIPVADRQYLDRDAVKKLAREREKEKNRKQTAEVDNPSAARPGH
jgi:excisionase family DNA binding protein